MDIISKHNKQTRPPRILRNTIMAVYAVLLATVLAIVNIYPMRIMENKIIQIAREDMLDDASNLAIALMERPTLSPYSVDRAVSVLNLKRDNRRIIVTDRCGVAIYDSESENSLYGKIVAFSEVLAALSGEQAFHCIHEDGAFDKWAAAPVVGDEQLCGTVYLYENDTNSALLLRNIAYNLRMVSLCAVLLSSVCLLIVNRALGRRFGMLLMGIREAREGNFSYRIKMKGSDELAKIASEVNDLSAIIQANDIARRRFVSDASHELKTPLASIKLLSDSISQNKNIKPETVNEFLEDINGEIARLIRISEELIAINKVGDVTEELYVCDVLTTVEKAVERLRVNAETAKVTLQVECEKGCTVLATDDGIHHIVFNLIENAIKYNREGGKVRIRLRCEGSKVCLAVMDTGIGIPAHDQRRVFERFFRVDKNRSRATGGTGLGLSIVKEWADKFGATIKLESYFGEGTEFTVVFPLHKVWVDEEDLQQ